MQRCNLYNTTEFFFYLGYLLYYMLALNFNRGFFITVFLILIPLSHQLFGDCFSKRITEVAVMLILRISGSLLIFFASNISASVFAYYIRSCFAKCSLAGCHVPWFPFGATNSSDCFSSERS